ncbi:hypothetical protein V7S43_010181 [Phytophthora oleae]|uniref:Ion transport domain-containing protein n=1 Tax=Phytophthora oleae TaxID=2107226 RepID=A0ABD3FH36_9STRA
MSDDMSAEVQRGAYRGVRYPTGGLRPRRGSRRPPPTKIGDLHVWTLKERLQAFLDGPVGIVIEAVNVVLSLVLVTVAIADTYYDPELDEDSQTYQVFEVLCTVLFEVDYVMHLFAAQNFLGYFLAPVSIVDFVTIVPVLLGYAYC